MNKQIEILKKLMEQQGDNTVTLGRKIGATNQAVSLWLLGKRIPKICHPENIADLYGVSVDFLLGR